MEVQVIHCLFLKQERVVSILQKVTGESNGMMLEPFCEGAKVSISTAKWK